MKKLYLLLIFSFYIVLSGCSHYLYTESTLSKFDSIKLPEVIKTELYKKIKNKVKTVAIIAPDYCREQSALSASTQQRNFIRSSCGVALGLIEKQLLSQEFSVISWEMLKSLSKDKSFFQAGKELGIDIFFSINSLENITADSLNINLKRQYFKSDSYGVKGKPWDLHEKHKKIIRAQLKDDEDSVVRFSLGAAIDVTAIDVQTGKSLWYYQASFYNINKKEKIVTAAFRGKKNIWRMFQKDGLPIESTIKRKSSNIEKENKKSQLSDGIYFQYLKVAISSFIQSFKTGH